MFKSFISKKNSPIIIGALFFISYLFLVYIYYFNTNKYAIEEGHKRVDQILFQHRAIHSYVENMQKPVIYKLKYDGKLYNEFFQPEVLSSTFIARNMHNFFIEEMKKQNLEPYSYKLASNNPRNPINKANELEAELIKKANEQSFKHFDKILDENGKKYLYTAIPINSNQQSCLKCHGDPKDAPKEMIDRYGTDSGYFEKVGEIRAIISLKVPLDELLSNSMKIFYILSSVTAIVFLSIYLIIYIIIIMQRRLEKEKEEYQYNLLLQQSKSAAMGQMIGNIAHQWKQPLNAMSLMIMNVEDMFSENELDKESMDNFVKNSISQIKYMSTTIDDFRNFFKPNKEKIDFDAIESVNNALKILNPSIKANQIQVNVKSDNQFILHGLINELTQVFIILINNSKDAFILNDIKDRTIFIDINGSNKQIIVQDNGGGIPKEHINKIFQEYFTTKGKEGTGIGLNIAKMILQSEYSANISFDNIENGVRFTIKF
ncbi:MAG: DUF3365 domain-containing protein [Campylobacterales bacterium]|nr:DUF3365 domain-containing protein [Campylobacterales bacterium]